MAVVAVACRYCETTHRVVKRGQSSSGKQRYHCRNCGRYFQLNYVYNASKPGVKERIITMAMKGSGVRETMRVLQIGINTVIGTLKKYVPEVCKSEIKTE